MGNRQADPAIMDRGRIVVDCIEHDEVRYQDALSSAAAPAGHLPVPTTYITKLEG